MSQNGYQVVVDGKHMVYPRGTEFYDIALEFQKDYSQEIVLVMVNNKLHELKSVVEEDCQVRFVTTAENSGNLTYVRSAILLLLKSLNDIAGENQISKVRVLYSIGNGLYFTMNSSFELTQEFLDLVKGRMLELSDMDLPLDKRSIDTDAAIERFRKHKMYDKEKLFRYRKFSRVNLYRINEFEDYFYGYMVPSTRFIKKFDLITYDEGFIMRMPDQKTGELVPFQPPEKFFHVLQESTAWGDMLGIDTVGALNDKISDGEIHNLILVQEALQEKRIADIAEQISLEKDVKFVMIAGPSSSGKTTFSHRLSVQLLAHGLKPHPIPVDNYYLNREQVPVDENGELDFECLEALDIEQFNADMSALSRGETVEIPQFNFKTGKREYNGTFLTLGEEDILVIEGIHGLNDKLSYSLAKELKFKIYISALTQLNIDEHNRIPTTDGRLIRRIVRDARTRGTSAQETLGMWASVRRGEEKHIFPFQEEADVMINSSLIYELAVLKSYAEPLLSSIDRSSKEYVEAKRLLKFLDYFLPIPSENIANNSIVREFIGGSCFNV